MASLPAILSFEKLYSDHDNNQLGEDEDEDEDQVVEALTVIYTEWRTADRAPKVANLEGDVLAAFYMPIGSVGMLVANRISKTCRLKLLHGFERYTGGVGRADPDRKVNFCFEGDIDGTDILTVQFDPNQLGLTPYVNVASSVARHFTLLKAEPIYPWPAPLVPRTRVST
jgi:hypothetical protein